MRVAVVCQSATDGGAERLMTRLYDRSSGEWGEVRLFGSMAGWERSGWPSTELNLSPKWSKKTIAAGLLSLKAEQQRVFEAVESYKPDVIHMHFKREQIGFTKILSRIAPVVWTEHGKLSVGHVEKYLGRAYRRAARHASRVVAITPEVADSLRKYVPDGNLTVIPNGVDTSIFHPVSAEDRAAARRRLGVTSDGTLAAFVGRLHPNKGVLQAIEASVSAGINIVVAGDGPLRQAVESFDSGHVTYVGRVDNAAPIFHAADIHLLTSVDQEGLPTTLLEASSCGVPTVAFPESAIDLHISEAHGWIVERAGILPHLSSLRRAELDFRGTQAREWACQFSLDTIRSTYADLFRRLRDNRRQRTIRVVHAVRDADERFGVGRVVSAIQKELRPLGIESSTFSYRGPVDDTSQEAQYSRGKLRTAVDVAVFTLVGSLRSRALARDQDTVVFDHNDTLFGDVYVNHGLLKAAIWNDSARRNRSLRNPFHLFLLAREEIRHRVPAYRRVVALAQDDLRDLDHFYGVPREKITLLRNGFDPQYFRAATVKEREVARAQLGLFEDDFTLVFVGHEFERKGLDLALEAVARTGAGLLVVGGREQDVSAWHGRAVELGVASRCTWAGFQNDVRPYLWAADALVLPTRYETGPLVLLEALACGLPVVMTRTGLAEDVVIEGVTGFICQRDTESVVNAVESIKALRLSLPTSALQERCRDAVESYTWPQIAREYAELALSVVREKRGS